LLTRNERPSPDFCAEERQTPPLQPDLKTAERKQDKPSPAETVSQTTNKSTSRLRRLLWRHPYLGVVAVVLILAILAGVVLWWLHARNFESTDDAFIDARVVPISAEVAGEIVGVPVTDNQLVKAGAVLIRIDPRDYRAALAQAKAELDQARADIANVDAQIGAQQAKVDQARHQVTQTQAALKFAQEQNGRAQNLLHTGAGTTQNAQQATTNLQQAQATFESAEDNHTAAVKQIAVLRTQREVNDGKVEQAQAAMQAAQANLSRVTITAPGAGRASKLSAAVGAYAQPGQTLMMFVPRDMWVTANFKETQLDLIRAGQPVSIAVDAYPGRTFHGHVNSIQAGSGAAFSLLPPENATGNYVKVVQRVPVKITFDKPPDVYLGPGMSVVPTVRVR
jgi:membrane fusion protein, multidrug efflux system